LIRHTISSFVLLIATYLLQSVVTNNLAIGGIKPDLIIVLVIAVAFRYGRMPGMFMGFFAGLFLDCMESDLLGYYAMFYMTAGYCTGLVNQFYFDESVLIPTGLAAAAKTSVSIMEYIAGFLLRNRLDFPYYFIRLIIPEVMYTVIISFFLYRFYVLVYKKVDALKIVLSKKKEEKEDEIV